MTHNSIFDRQKGFSLIELAIVLVIVGVLIGGFVGTLSTRIDNTRKADVIDELETIKTALLGFAYSTGGVPYLPCPDCIEATCSAGFRDGREDRSGAVCDIDVSGNTGTLPWITLGLGRGDAWNTRYRYWVDPAYATNAGFTLAPLLGTGVINERTADGTGLQVIANNVVAVIYSHGKNGFGGISTDNIGRDAIPAANVDELDNTDNAPGFVSRPQTDPGVTTGGGPFDDIVIWISAYELKAKMVEAGRLP